MSFKLGKLEKVPLRDIWKTEAADFTPWLAQEENLKILSDSIGIELELEAQEKNVGPFRADILCKDTISSNWVLIENQLERTDHTHLGQLITYASGLKAVTIVWIANNFTEEHRASLDWLNEISDSRFNFFGLEIELWRIGDSPVAPKFNIISKPNDWSRTVSASASSIEEGELSQAKELQRSFWTSFRDYVLINSKVIKPTKALPQHWMNIYIGRTGFQLSAIASMYDSETQSYDNQEIRAEFVIHNGHENDAFERFFENKNSIENEVGAELIWYKADNTKSRKIYLKKSANLIDESNWINEFKWLLDNLEKLYFTFSSRVKSI